MPHNSLLGSSAHFGHRDHGPVARRAAGLTVLWRTLTIAIPSSPRRISLSADTAGARAPRLCDLGFASIAGVTRSVWWTRQKLWNVKKSATACTWFSIFSGKGLPRLLRDQSGAVKGPAEVDAVNHFLTGGWRYSW
jgi:hypothetical protein